MFYKRSSMQIFTNLRRIALFILSMVLSLGILFAQERTITGKVSAEGEEQLPDVKALQDSVVTGYTTQRKRDITGSVSVIEPAKLTAVPSGNVSNQLQGRASGVTVVGSGQPGSTSKVRIRGFGSFENNDPLYVVDGVPTQDISSMNPNDIESISVLKDAGAASIYGSRASNGVIIVTTKEGNNGLKVTYDMYMGTQSPGKGTSKDLLDTKEYANLQWLVYKNDGTVETHPVYGSSQNPAPSIPPWAANTDWYDAITDPAGIQNHDLTLSGSTDNTRFFAGFGYFRQDGIIIYTHAERFSARFNSEFTLLKDRVKMGENFTIAYRSNLGVSNLNEDSPIQMGPYRSQSIVPVIITKPITGYYHNFVPGDWGGTGMAPRLGNASNVVATLTRDKDDKYWNIRMIGSAFIDVKILKGLSFRSTLGGTWNNGYGVNYTFATYENSVNISTANLGENSYFSGDWIWTNSLTLDRTFEQHKILAVAGYEAVQYGIGRDMYAQRAGYFSNDVDYRTLTNGATIEAASSSFNTPTNLSSSFLKADYVFMDKYLLSATVRRDGCSRFGKADRFGVFPSFSAGWRIGDETFLDGLDWISDLKIRGSWGTMGNQLAVSPQNAVFLFGDDVTLSYYDLYGTFNSSVRGFYPLRIANPNARWETNVTTNIGFDAGLFSSKVNIVFDWYSKRTKDLLFNPELPGIAGGAEQPYVNVASINNSGIDLELSFKNNWGDLGFNGSVVFTTYRNEITRIAEGVDFFNWGSSSIGPFVRNEVGHPISSFYGYQVIRLFQNDAEVNKAPSQDGAETGFLRFANNDTTTNWWNPGWQGIDYNDKTFIGNPNPTFTYGFNLGFNYKNFDLSAFIYGSQGNDIFNWNKWWIDFWPSYQGQKSKALLYDSWTSKNKDSKVPKASNKSNFSTNTQVCSYYVEDGSYLRLKNLQLGYSFPADLLSKVNIKYLRIYVQAVNLFTLTKYSGLDPELGGDDRAFGVDYGNYPNVKQFIFGLNLTL